MVTFSGCRNRRTAQAETINMEDHVWVKKGTKIYLKRESGEVKIE